MSGLKVGDRVRPSVEALRTFRPTNRMGRTDTRGRIVRISMNLACGYVHFDGSLSPMTTPIHLSYFEAIPEGPWIEASEGPSGLIPEKAQLDNSHAPALSSKEEA